jgi:hypothetical protein
MKPLIAKTQTEHKLYQLQAEWNHSSGKARLAIAQSIQDHPEWDIEIGINGPQLKTSLQLAQEIATQTPPKSNLSLVKALSHQSPNKSC